MEQGSKKPLVATIVVLLVIAGVVGGVVASGRADNSTGTSSTTASTSPSTGISAGSDGSSSSSASNSSTGSSTTTANFKAGVYTATGNYNTPGGPESITVSLTIKDDGTITDSTASGSGNDDETREYQGQFIGAYKQEILGKKISSVSLSRVSGSSLTSQGFNDAVEKIADQAKA